MLEGRRLRSRAHVRQKALSRNTERSPVSVSRLESQQWYPVRTRCLKKTIHLTFDHNFGICRPIFTIRSREIPDKTLYVIVTVVFTLP